MERLIAGNYMFIREDADTHLQKYWKGTSAATSNETAATDTAVAMFWCIIIFIGAV